LKNIDGKGEFIDIFAHLAELEVLKAKFYILALE